MPFVSIVSRSRGRRAGTWIGWFKYDAWSPSAQAVSSTRWSACPAATQSRCVSCGVSTRARSGDASASERSFAPYRRPGRTCVSRPVRPAPATRAATARRRAAAGASTPPAVANSDSPTARVSFADEARHRSPPLVVEDRHETRAFGRRSVGQSLDRRGLDASVGEPPPIRAAIHEGGMQDGFGGRGAACRQQTDASDAVGLVVVRPQRDVGRESVCAAATRRLNRAAPHEIVSSRSSGSLTGNARVRSATSSIACSSTRNRQGCVLWLDGASVAAVTSSSRDPWVVVVMIVPPSTTRSRAR